MINFLKKNKIRLSFFLLCMLILLFLKTNFTEQKILNFIENLENQRFRYFK
jgi:hypothetical protein